MKFYEAYKKNRDELDKCKFREGSKPGGSTKLHVIEQLFMFLVWLRCGYGQKQLAWLFGVAKSTVSWYLITCMVAENCQQKIHIFLCNKC